MIAASQKRIIVKKLKFWPKFGEIIKKDRAVIWKVVLVFAIKLTLTGLPPDSSAKNCLNEEIIISLKIIMNAGIKRLSCVWYEIR